MTTNLTRGELHVKCGAFQKTFTLSSDQRGILSKVSDAQYVLVAGPPGTGKTTVLLCKGLQWLQEGKEVLVGSIHRASIPTCWYLYTVLNEAKQAHDNAQDSEDSKWGRVQYDNRVLTTAQDVQDGANYIQNYSSSTRPLAMLFDYMAPETVDRCQLALDFIKELKERLPQSPIWTSDWFSTVPDDFNLRHLMQPLRFTRQIFPLIKVPVETLELNNKLPATYSYRCPMYRDNPSGPDVIHLRHKGGKRGGDDDDKWPIHSEKCGRRVAKMLRQLGVGSSADGQGEEPSEDDKAKAKAAASKGEHFQFRDVLVVTRNEVKRGETPPFARGLEAAGIPTSVFGTGDYLTVEEALDDIILAPEDKVMLTNYEACVGLDRKLIVCLTGIAKDETWEVTEEEDQQIKTNQYPAGTVTLGDATLNLTLDMTPEQQKAFREKLLHAHRSEMELIHRLTIWTRCCRQLIVVHLPEDVQGQREFKVIGDSRRCVVM